jgi:uncharacterized caspase-like protein
LRASCSRRLQRAIMNKLLSLVAMAAAVAFVVVGASVDAWAERRVALVVGNANYKFGNISLANPRNDAEDVSAVLKTLGFEVKTTVDASKRDMDLALADFARRATDADSALFFYAGHALQFQGRNYLMPTDAELEDEISVRYQTVSLQDVTAALDRANGVKIMILDACRNNPLADRLQKAITGAARSLATTRGLARIDKAQGMVVAYATAAEEVAQDGQGRNSPFTSALLRRLQEPGLEIEMMFRRVAADVNAQTGGRQRPETTISLLSEYYLNQSDRIVWDRIKGQDDVAALRDFVNKYPSSPYAIIARNRLELLERLAREREEDARRAREEEKLRREAEERLRDEQLAAQKRKEEDQKRQDALRQQQEDQKRQEALRQQQEDQKRQDALRQQQEDQKRQEALRQQQEDQKRQDALRQQQEDQKRQEALRQQQEDQKRQDALRQQQEDQKRQDALRQQQEDQKRQEALRQQQEDQKRQDALRQQQEDQKEEQRRAAALQQREEQKRQESLRQQQQADLERQRIEQNCRSEEAKLKELEAAGAAAREQLAKFEIEAGCKALQPMITAALAALPAPPAANMPPPETTPPDTVAEPPVAKKNHPEQIRQAQSELTRLGCFNGKPDGQLNEATRNAVKALWKHTGKPIVEINITDEFVDELKRLRKEICPPERRPAAPVASRPSSRSKEVTAAPSRPAVAEKPAKPEPPHATNISSGRTLGAGF